MHFEGSLIIADLGDRIFERRVEAADGRLQSGEAGGVGDVEIGARQRERLAAELRADVAIDDDRAPPH